MSAFKTHLQFVGLKMNRILGEHIFVHKLLDCSTSSAVSERKFKNKDQITDPPAKMLVMLAAFRI